jgi:hypothetical protein
VCHDFFKNKFFSRTKFTGQPGETNYFICLALYEPSSFMLESNQLTDLIKPFETEKKVCLTTERGKCNQDLSYSPRRWRKASLGYIVKERDKTSFICNLMIIKKTWARRIFSHPCLRYSKRTGMPRVTAYVSQQSQDYM